MRILKRVALNRSDDPARAFRDTVDLELREGRVPIGAALTRAVLTMTAESGAVVVVDSADEGWGAGQPFAWDAATGVLSIRFGGLVPTLGPWDVELDVSDGSGWWRWTLTDQLTVVAE